jgi:hypothetical protein
MLAVPCLQEAQSTPAAASFLLQRACAFNPGFARRKQLLKMNESIRNFYVQCCHHDEMKLVARTMLVRAPAKYSVQKSGNQRKRNDARAQECVYELHELQREGVT